MEQLEGRNESKLQKQQLPRLKILLIEDEPAIAQTLYETLGEEGHRVTLSHDGSQAMSRIDAEVFDLVISDIRLPGVDGLTIFARLRQEAPNTRVILMSAYGSIAEAVRAMKEKAAHYLAKPFDLNELVLIVEHIAEERRIEHELHRAERDLDTDVDPDATIAGSTPAMVLIKRSIAVIAKSMASVLITGENGTGKELIARTIHERSPRAQGPFIAVNCATLPEAPLEAELFGSGAVGTPEYREGKFRAAMGGTLFLDDVGEMSPGAQARLLRALETDGEDLPGSDDAASKKNGVRIISASAGDIQQRVEDGRFRADLYYRLKVFQLRLPALRERRPDLPLLIKHFYEKAGGKSTERIPATPRAWAALNQYRFPGNVRELRSAIEHAVGLARGQQIDVEHLPDELRGRDVGRSEPENAPTSLPTAVREFEREYVIRTLMSVGGQKQRAADQLGISRKTLWVKLRQYGIHDFDGDE